MAKIAIACASSGIGMSFFNLMSAKIIPCGISGLRSWADASMFSIKDLTHFKAPSNFPTVSFYKLVCILQSHFHGEATLRAEETQTFLINIGNAGAAAVNKRPIDEGITQYRSTARLL